MQDLVSADGQKAFCSPLISGAATSRKPPDVFPPAGCWPMFQHCSFADKMREAAQASLRSGGGGALQTVLLNVLRIFYAN